MKHIVQAIFAVIGLIIALDWLAQTIVANALGLALFAMAVSAWFTARFFLKRHFERDGRYRHLK